MNAHIINELVYVCVRALKKLNAGKSNERKLKISGK